MYFSGTRWYRPALNKKKQKRNKQKKKLTGKPASNLLFDMLPAGYRVPHTGTSKSFNILHNNKRFLL